MIFRLKTKRNPEYLTVVLDTTFTIPYQGSKKWLEQLKELIINQAI